MGFLDAKTYTMYTLLLQKEKKRQNKARMRCLLEHENRLLGNAPGLANAAPLSHAFALDTQVVSLSRSLQRHHYSPRVTLLKGRSAVL